MSLINVEIKIPSENYKTVINVLKALNVTIKKKGSEGDLFYPELEKKIQKAREEKENGTLKTFDSVEQLWENL